MSRRAFDRLALVVVAFLALTALVSLGATDGVDAAVLSFALGWRSPAVDQVFQAITLLGDPVVSSLLAIALTLLLVSRDGRRGQVALIFFAGFVIEFALKQVIDQPGTPSEFARDAVLLPGLRELSPYSYPGGHALRVMFLAALLWARSARLRLPLAIVVALVAIGRVYLAIGWVADVAGGLLLGLALAMAAELIAERSATRAAATVPASAL